jgi:hypothetical protein
VAERFGETWKDYRTKVLPLDAPAIQARECRRAYYAGAWALLSILLGQLEQNTDGEPTAADLRLMDDLHAEMLAFGERVKEGKA